MISNGEIPYSCEHVLDPLDLPRYYDGCNATFSIYHAIDYKWGSLVPARYNDLRDRVADLPRKDFTPSRVRNYPFIFAGCAVKRPKENPTRTKGTAVPDVTLPL